MTNQDDRCLAVLFGKDFAEAGKKIVGWLACREGPPGNGSFSSVHRAVHKRTGIERAVKKITKASCLQHPSCQELRRP